jgi:hypothetical protein
MRIIVPAQRVYYYECTGQSTRLFYYLPPRELKKIVTKQQLSLQIIEDYPDGIEIEVSIEESEQYYAEYGIYFIHNPILLDLAFNVARYKSNKGRMFRGIGFIDAAFLEHLTNLIYPVLIQSNLQRYVVHKETPANKEWIEGRRLAVDRFWEIIKTTAIPEINPELPLNNQPFSRVKMYKGDDPVTVFRNLHQSTGKRKNANNQG